MKTKTNCIPVKNIVTVLLLALGSCVPVDAAVQPIPKGLTAADWAIIQQAYFKASNTEGTDQFGFSVAVSGDTVVVGALLEDSNATGVNGNQSDNTATNSGAAYVFVRSGTTWTQQAYLKASNTAPPPPGQNAGGGFGWSVAVSGDTVVVGALREDSNATGVNGDQSDESATNSGAAYVFVRSGTTWSQQAYLKASNTETLDNFGWSVAVSSDTVVVAAQGEDSNAIGVNGNQSNNAGTDSGAAYVFVRNGTTWSQQAYLKASNTGANDDFGGQVAISGDTVVVGALGEASNATGVNGDQSNNSLPNSGAAYVFVRNGTTWSQQAYLKASNTERGDFFGRSVGVSGHTVIVSAPQEDSAATGVDGNQTDNSATAAGAAYVFERRGTTWTQQAYLKASNTETGDVFGRSAAISGDMVVIGAQHEDSGATGVNGDQADNSSPSSGAAYVFGRSGTTWTQQAYLKASNTELNDQFGGVSIVAPGASVAVSGDTVVVGAWMEDSGAIGVNGDQSDNGALNSGAAYVFTGLGPATDRHVPSQYANIQAAVDAAVSGDTIRIAAGNYPEQIVIIDKTNVTLAGEAGAVIGATETMSPTLLSYGDGSVAVLGIVRSDVMLRGLTFDGGHLGAFHSSRRLRGLLFLGSGGRVENCIITGFRADVLTNFSNAQGMHTHNPVSLGTAPVNLGVFNSTFTDNETSMFIRGDPANPTVLRTTFVIEGNTIRGLGPSDATADGIDIVTGAQGEVRGNIITDHSYTGSNTNAVAWGLGAVDARAPNRTPPRYFPVYPIRCEGNIFSNNNLHLLLIQANDSRVANNIFQGTAPGRAPLGVALSGTNILVANNDFSDMPTGIVLFGNEPFYFPGVPVGSAVNPKLLANWFCNVAEPIRTSSLGIGVQEQGTEICPFRPTFQSIRRLDSGDTALTVRSWHGQPVVIEASTDFQQWVPVHTNAMTLPSVQHEDPGTAGVPHRFYRALVP